MFGYVKPFAPDLYVREYELYRAVYCGICKSMHRRTGFFSSFTLSYDSVFLALVRMLYGDRDIKVKKARCLANPFRRRKIVAENPAIEYTARVCAILIYEKLRDDLHDGGFLKKCRSLLLLPYAAYAKRRANLPLLSASVRDALSRLSALEREGVASVDAPATVFGELLGEVFAYGMKEEDRETLYDIGHALGRYIYAADAAEDYPDDVKGKSYNPYVLSYGGAPLDGEMKKTMQTSLTLTLGTLASALEYLPFGNAAAVESILKNTVYVGLPERLSFLKDTASDEKKGTL